MTKQARHISGDELKAIMARLKPREREAVNAAIEPCTEILRSGISSIAEGLAQHGVRQSKCFVAALAIHFQATLDAHITTAKAIGWTKDEWLELMGDRWDKWHATLMTPGEVPKA